MMDTHHSKPKPAFPSKSRSFGDKIVRRKLSDEVFDRLREMVATGEFRAGDQLPSERSLMERFGVGRPAVREALQSMQTKGLITISHGGRSRVNALSAEDVLDRADEVAQMLLLSGPDQLDYLKEARRMFEMGTVRLAAKRAKEDDISDLRAILEEQRSHLGDPEPFMDADIRFHTRIAEMAGNPIMSAAANAMLRWLFRYHTTLLHWSGKEKVTLAEHERIIEMLSAGDSDQVVVEMRQHLERGSDFYRHQV